MNLYNIPKSDLTSKIAPAKGQQLHSGQILHGKVMKLYPDNKADILLGGKRLIANLEVGLQAGARYHFQVQSTASVIQLKVLGEALKGKSEVDTSGLLNQLGLKDTRANANLLNTLFRSKIPFDHQQIVQAANLLKDEKDKPAATRIIIEMIARKLPVQSSILRALSEASQTSITKQLTSVIAQLGLTANIQSSGQTSTNAETNLSAGTKENLHSSLTALINQPVPFTSAITQAIQDKNTVNNQSLFRTLQGLGLVHFNIDFSQWVSQWGSVAGEMKESHVNQQTALPFQLQEQAIMQTLSKVEAQKPEFTAAVNKILSQWGNQLHFHSLVQSGMTKEDFTNLQQALKENLHSFIPENQRILLGQLANSSNHLSALYQALQVLNRGEELANILQIMQKAVQDEQFLALPPKQQFLQHQNQFMQSLGLDYENQLLRAGQAGNQTETIKGLLLQLLNNSETSSADANQKLLHLINGMQIKSVNETQSIVQANLQIPAERLGLIKDIELEFEGRKTKDGQIDPDFCRILFHLNLQQLNETVIDMHIHQRNISLIVFNNHEGIKLAGNLLRDKLDESIENVGYTLTAVQYKKIEEKSYSPTGFEQALPDTDKQGVDFRI